ncbi:hypothetical protein K3152_08305 [Qipengyuania sp. 1NDH17]|uniref:Peroxidase n=1 Tax=Qipengyuania polymorpha TaxID=2867234 RepID=A0ABS7J193_9SPHN|nr:hypothetical protein [Qipengyuania polymorpha]MBX7458246.1 hypothetical protein [Qipengyuania polymorpha]
MSDKNLDGSSWKLAKSHAHEVQGMVVSGFSHLPISQTLLLQFKWPGTAHGGKWLQKLEKVAPVTPADGKQDSSVSLGITATGLRKMGVGEEILAGFSQPFREGMFQTDRMRRLNDRVGKDWSECVIKGGPLWSANTPFDHAGDGSGQLANLPRRDSIEVETELTVHAILIIHCKEAPEAAAWAQRTADVLKQCDVDVVRAKETTLGFDGEGMVREHYGFVDGLSQPIPWDEKAVHDAPPEPDPVNGIALGDVLLGHVDGHHEVTKGPLVERQGKGLADPDDKEGLDLLFNGTYLVVRELRQDVAGFWKSAKRIARSMGPDPKTGRPFGEDWVGERVIGRSMAGDVLRPGGVLKRKDPAVPDNDFLYFDDDRAGLGCPLGSHIRRGNPRDGLATKPSQTKSLLASSNRHRIIRRARKFGPYIEDRMVDDGVERGLMFGVINADIERQFEFVQQTWMMSPSFRTLFDETDPLLGPKSHFSMGAEPVRRRVTVHNHTRLAGGDYFFMPSLPAIEWLSRL